MPILYIHGVNTRSRDGFKQIKPFLRRLVAPAISQDPEGVMISDIYWGDKAASFAWDGISRPKSRLLGMGAGATPLTSCEGAFSVMAFDQALNRLPVNSVFAHSNGGLISGNVAGGSSVFKSASLREFDTEEMSDLLAIIIQENIKDPMESARFVLAVDEVVRDPATQNAIASASNPDEELNILLERLRLSIQSDAELIGMGVPNWLKSLKDRLGEVLDRAVDLPSYAVSVVAAELRKPLNDFVSVFIGDVLAYINNRGHGSKPGEIPKLFIDSLKHAHVNKAERNGEKIVVLSHSMGGQIVYDVVSHFLPEDETLRDLQIDFWCATASQVGFFEELKLFHASLPKYKNGNPVPFPDKHLGDWWNVWDHNDFLSFTTSTIFDGVKDESFDSGMSLIEAHSGYLKRPSFYRKLASKLR